MGKEDLERAHFVAISGYVAKGATMHLMGCEVAQTEQSRQQIQKMAQRSGLTFEASDVRGKIVHGAMTYPGGHIYTITGQGIVRRASGD
jgi:hypothetical protein